MSKRSVHCQQCGSYTKRGGRAQRSKLCAECAMAKARRVAWEMHRHDGPTWDAYVASGQILGRPDQLRGPDGRYLPRPRQEPNHTSSNTGQGDQADGRTSDPGTPRGT